MCTIDALKVKVAGVEAMKKPHHVVDDRGPGSLVEGWDDAVGAWGAVGIHRQNSATSFVVGEQHDEVGAVDVGEVGVEAGHVEAQDVASTVPRMQWKYAVRAVDFPACVVWTMLSTLMARMLLRRRRWEARAWKKRMLESPSWSARSFPLYFQCAARWWMNRERRA